MIGKEDRLREDASDDIPLDAACLVGCGVSTGYGAAVKAEMSVDTEPREAGQPRPVAERTALFIGGHWTEPRGNAVLEVRSPASGAVVGRVPKATTADADRAVEAARRAFDEGPWPRMTVAMRVAVLERFADALTARADDITRLVSSEAGTPVRVPAGAGAGMITRATLEAAARATVREERDTPLGRALVTHEPVGTVGIITPWNGPVFLLLERLLPALLAGCTVVAKPPEETPLACYLVAELLGQAGLPDGVVSIMAGGPDVGEHLVRHPGIDKIAFTGSVATGARVAELCGTRLARVNLELGGKSPAIVLPDADLDTVAAQMLAGCFIGSGQACNALTRLIVPESRHDEVVGAVLEQLDSIRMGDPFDPATTHGPLISARQRERVERYVQSAHDEGARLLAGGGRPEGLPDGWFFEPTVFDDVTSEMTVAREEIFGPVLSVLRYSGDEREAVRIANDSDYGLHGAVFTTDLDRGLAVAGQVRSGTFSINCYRTNMYVPYGGMKSSGIGRKFDTVGLEAYTEIKTVNLP